MSDLISRQAVLKILSSKNAAWDAYDKVKQLSSVEPELKHGKWTAIEDKYGEEKFYCSCCNDWNSYGDTDYCPLCGARMDLEE